MTSLVLDDANRINCWKVLSVTLIVFCSGGEGNGCSFLI